MSVLRWLAPVAVLGSGVLLVLTWFDGAAVLTILATGWLWLNVLWRRRFRRRNRTLLGAGFLRDLEVRNARLLESSASGLRAVDPAAAALAVAMFGVYWLCEVDTKVATTLGVLDIAERPLTLDPQALWAGLQCWFDERQAIDALPVRFTSDRSGGPGGFGPMAGFRF
jgi:hypothetical protein